MTKRRLSPLHRIARGMGHMLAPKALLKRPMDADAEIHPALIAAEAVCINRSSAVDPSHCDTRRRKPR
jgi:hypothetical protein